MGDPLPPESRPPEKTEIQPEASRAGSETLSRPAGIERHPQAPDIPGYILVGMLGSGAYAQVWKSWQARTRKWVAVKVFVQKSGVDWLFLQREVERLIRLDKHPHIVSLLDADLDGEIPYYVMDYMEGGSLERFVDAKNPLAPEKAALWMDEMAQALSYVHAKGLIHCDLKPANVLFDDEGHVRLADFGQSRIVTDSAGALGTLFYMAPEQAVAAKEGEPLQPDVRWDVYGLGTTIWAVLKGRVPHATPDLRARLEAAAGLEPRLAIYRESVLSRPLESCRGPGIDEDLAAVVDQCAAARPGQRYSSAREVLDDLAARRETRPVKPLAGRASYRLKKFVRRNAAIVALAVSSATALAWSFAAVVRERDAARRELAFSYVSRAQRAVQDNDWAAALLYFVHANQIFPSDLARRSAAASLAALSRPVDSFDGSSMKAQGVGLSPDLRTLIVCDAGGAQLFDWKTRKPKGEKMVFGGGLRAFSFSSDGKLLVTATQDGTIRVWDALTARPAGKPFQADTRIPKGEMVMVRTHIIGRVDRGSVAVSRGGDRVLVAAYNDSAQLFDARRGVQLGDRIFNAGTGVSFSPDGKTAAAFTYGGAGLYSAETGKELGPPLKHEGSVGAAAFSPDGARFAIAGEDGLSLYDLLTHQALGRWKLEKASISSMAFDPHGAFLVLGMADGRAVRWSLKDSRPTGPWLVHASKVTDVSVGPDGALATTSGATVRVWGDPAATARERVLQAGEEYDRLQAASYLPGGRTLVTVDGTGEVREWDARSLAPVGKPRRLAIQGLVVRQLLFTPDLSKALAVAYGKGTRILDMATGRRIGAELAQDDIQSAEISPDGKLILTVPGKGPARVWDSATGLPLGRPLAHDGPIRSASFSPDSRRVVTGGEDHAIRLWDARSGAPEGPAMDLRDKVWQVVFSPDGSRLAACGGKRVQLWDARSGTTLGPDLGSAAATMQMAFSTDGRRLLLVGADYRARIWDVAAFRPLGKALAHESFIESGVFSRDGQTVLTAAADKTVRLWDAQTGEQLGPSLFDAALEGSARFSPDEEAVMAGDRSGPILRFWNVSWLKAADSPASLSRRAEKATRRRINARGDIEAVPETL